MQSVVLQGGTIKARGVPRAHVFTAPCFAISPSPLWSHSKGLQQNGSYVVSKWLREGGEVAACKNDVTAIPSWMAIPQFLGVMAKALRVAAITAF